MTSVRLRTCAVGAALAVAAAALTRSGAALGDELAALGLLGLTAGAVVGLVPDRAVTARAAAFGLGLLAAWAGYAARAAVLPDVPLGRALAAVLVVSLVTAVATATNGRLPLWAGLLGAGTLVGGYATAFTADPAGFTTASTGAVTALLLAAAVGLVVTALLPVTVTAGTAAPAAAPVEAPASEPGSLADLFPAPRAAAEAAPSPSETSR